MASKRTQIRDLMKRLKSMEDREANAVRAFRLLKSRIDAEYQRHVPEIVPEEFQISLGTTIWRRDVKCAAEDCPYFWPCPTWHLMRRLYNGDEATYSLHMERIEPKP